MININLFEQIIHNVINYQLLYSDNFSEYDRYADTTHTVSVSESSLPPPRPFQSLCGYYWVDLSLVFACLDYGKARDRRMTILQR